MGSQEKDGVKRSKPFRGHSVEAGGQRSDWIFPVVQEGGPAGGYEQDRIKGVHISDGDDGEGEGHGVQGCRGAYLVCGQSVWGE